MDTKKNIGYWTVLSILLAQLAGLNSVEASGGYSARMTGLHRPSERGQIDEEKFKMGQRVFAGKVNLGEGDSDTQRAKLTALQTLLPAKVAQSKDLPSLAGKLSTSQLDALDYFLNQRYNKAK